MSKFFAPDSFFSRIFGTAADLMTNPAILADAHAEFAITAAEGYDCPLEPDLVAEPAAI